MAFGGGGGFNGEWWLEKRGLGEGFIYLFSNKQNKTKGLGETEEGFVVHQTIFRFLFSKNSF